MLFPRGGAKGVKGAMGCPTKGCGAKGQSAAGAFGKGKAGPGMQHQQLRGAPRMTSDQLKETLHPIIFSALAEAAAPVEYLETEWGEGAIPQKLTKYIYKAACDADLYSLPWPKMTEELVARAMHGYSAACQERDWFFSIDLAPVFHGIVSQIVANNGIMVPDELLYEACLIEYEDKLDKILLDRAMWEAAKNTFNEVLDEKSISKVFHALSKAYWPALDEVLEQSLVADFQGWLTPEQELQRVEYFFQKWVGDAMSRCWGGIQDSETVLTIELADMLFRTLLAPFGDEDPFSCAPQIFTEQIGRPPSDWAFIEQCLTQVYSQWGPGAPPQSKRARKAAAEAMHAM